ncbi:D-Ala-D-Ala carboxypeptidase family metallohydrolase [Sulfuricurvum sp.]|uniref:D-Ala-D-Ala carboxypeptidase family metallohydrolase n=1 Tax=Sulfuricurvum sp. TaxID=2025608 RepID=UPI0026341838|nr:D-Ala-D-Ala carboxypeptidase family metallohydrolase [Sulfuricurvum sp.]MDD4949649.1 D-Ala-D-Ala carboxypeptidase family metallohydrolase [Sulfuricurvum sp.]
MIQLKFFKLSEFTCKCGCGLNNMQDAQLLKLDKARELANIPFSVNCGTRCPKHNKDEGGEDNSSHLRGLATDISAKTSQEKFLIISALLKVGFKRIGVYSTFIHCDSDTTLPQNVIWHK